MPKRKPASKPISPDASLLPTPSTSAGKKAKRKTKPLNGESETTVGRRVTRSRSKHTVTNCPTVAPSVSAIPTPEWDDSNCTIESLAREAVASSHYFDDDDEAGKGNGASQVSLADDDSESSRDDWEEVADAVISSDDEEELNRHKASLPDEGISVELEHPRTKKRKQEKADLERKKLNRKKKQLHENLHKSHFLCLFAHGFHLNSMTNDQTVSAISLSYMSLLCHPPGPKSPPVDRRFVTSFMKDFAKHFIMDTESRDLQSSDIRDQLINCLTTRTTDNMTAYVMAFISLLRVIGRYYGLDSYSVRVCLPIRPLPLKASGLIRSEKEEERSKSGTAGDRKPRKNKRGMLSSDEEEEVIVEPKKVAKKRPSAANTSSSAKMLCPSVWSEVYLESESQWVCAEILNGMLDEPLAIEKTCEQPFNYVVAYEEDGIVKEVSCRYAEKALTASYQRLRAEKEWVEESLSFFRPIIKSGHERQEDNVMTAMLESRPMPKTISEFKSHPLYVLQRHLLVYEAIYPPDTRPIQHLREEPVYSRSCVKPVRSKEYWKRKARVLKEDAYPYKVIKGRKKWDKYAEKYMTDIPKDLFGFWQTEPYQPPVASGGKVPRNEFGNVELFQPCMLPIGCVHLRLPALARLANKLDIDCVPAVIGFDNAKAGVVPVMDGYVVCQEFKDTLLAAYAEEQENMRQKRESKRLQRVLANWRRLTRALIIREGLKRKYAD